MRTVEKILLAGALFALSLATCSRVVEVADPCFNSKTPQCIAALSRGE